MYLELIQMTAEQEEAQDKRTSIIAKQNSIKLKNQVESKISILDKN